MDTIDLTLSRLKTFDVNENGVFIVEQLATIADDMGANISGMTIF